MLPSLQRAKQLEPAYNRLSQIIGCAVFAIATVATFGYLLNRPVLTSYSLNPTAPLLTPYSIMAMLLIGLGLVTIAGRFRVSFKPHVQDTVEKATFIIPGITGLLSIFYIWMRTDFNVALAMFQKVSGIPMAYNTAICILLLSVCLFFLKYHRHSDVAVAYLVSLPAFIVVNIAIFALYGHFAGMPILFSFKMSIPMVICLLLSSFSLLVSTIPYKGLLLPFLDPSRKIRLMAALSIICGLGVIWEGINDLAFLSIMTGDLFQSPQDLGIRRYYFISAIASVILAVLIKAFSLRAMQYYSESTFYAKQKSNLAARESALRTILEVVQNQKDLGQIYQVTVEKLGEYLQADRCFICSFNASSQEITPPVQEYRSSEAVDSILDRLPLLAQGAKHIIRQLCDEKGVFAYNSQTPTLPEEMRACMVRMDVQSALTAAIMSGDECLALLFVHQTNASRHWSDDEIQFMASVVQQLGTALNQFQLAQACTYAEELLHEKLDFIKAITDNVSAGMVAVDDEGRITFVNPAAQAMLGYPEADILDKLINEVVLSPSSPAANRFLPEILSGQMIRNHEGVIRHRNGKSFPVEYYSSPIMSYGRNIGAVVAFVDITARKQAELELERRFQRENLLRRIVEIINNAMEMETILKRIVQEIGLFFQADRCLVCQYDMEGENPSMNPLSEYRRREETQPIRATVYPKRRAEAPTGNFAELTLITRTFQYALPEADPGYRRENHIKSALAVEIHYRGTSYGALILHQAEPRVWEPGEAALLQIIALNIGVAFYQAQLYQQEKSAKLAAEAANHKKSLFLASMSHELRTPLNSIIGYSEMIEQGMTGEITEKQRRFIHNVSLSGRHLLELVNEILDISKIEAGKLNLSIDWVDLRKLLAQLIDVFSELASAKNIVITSHIHQDVLGLEADPGRLKQIFINLISNAIKFNHQDGRVDIEIYPSLDKEWVLCEIRDTGYGIPEDKMPELFSEFYQVDNSYARQQEGTGLGLALTKRLVELHGGTIHVESTVGVGSVFTFQLPAKAAIAAPLLSSV